MTTDRRLQALELRKKGLSYQEIGEKLSITQQSAWELVAGAFKDYDESVRESVHEQRLTMLMQLDSVIKGHFMAAATGDTYAAQVLLKTVAEKSKLLGLYAPTRTELTGKDGAPVVPAGMPAVDLSGLSSDELAALSALLSKAQPKKPD